MAPKKKKIGRPKGIRPLWNAKTRGRYLKAARLGLKPEHCRGMMQGVSADLFRVWQREALEAPTEKFGKEFRLFLSAIDDARGEMCTEAINRMLHHASDNDSETAAKWEAGWL